MPASPYPHTISTSGPATSEAIAFAPQHTMQWLLQWRGGSQSQGRYRELSSSAKGIFKRQLLSFNSITNHIQGYKPQSSINILAVLGAQRYRSLRWAFLWASVRQSEGELNPQARPFRTLTAPFTNNSEDSSLYRYQPLDLSTHIRILHLRTGDEEEPLRCRIEHVDLAQSPSYEAVSYVWGSSDKPYQIETDDGSKIPLTASLYSALRDIRRVRMTGSNTFWADAICINQKDPQERSRQVRLMGSIYSNATTVITYIGPASPSDYMGIDLAEKIVGYADSHRGVDPDLRLMIENGHNQLGFPDARDPQWSALRPLLTREWSSRVWMVQEFLLNERVLMLCGRYILAWNTLLQMPRLAVDRKIPKATMSGSMLRTDNLSVLEVLRTVRLKDGQVNMTLLKLLQYCHVMASTDPRDKVYAVLGLACDQDELNIVPDYNMCAAQVYQDTAVRILETHPDLDILSSAHIGKSIEMPSWAPDWSFWSEDTPVPLIYDATLSQQGFYDACAGTTSKIKFDAHNSALTVKGMVLDRISFSSGKLGDGIFSSTDLIKNCDWFQYLRIKALGLKRSATEASAIEVFWRTLIANVIYDQQEASLEVGQWFSTYEKLLKWNADWAKGLPQIDITKPELNLAHKFLVAMYEKAERRSLGTTEKGYLCLAPPDIRVGDSVCILLGGRVPYVLRQDGDAYKLVGESYIHPFMKGEAFEDEALRESIRDIKLV